MAEQNDHNSNPTSPTAASGGGFLLSPAPSAASTTTTTTSITGLPHPRGHSLRPGSLKEDKVRHYISDRLHHINRRFVKKLGTEEIGNEDVVGYQSMSELCKDLDTLLSIIWLSGTPSLQIPYLLNIASEFNEWVQAFPSAPTPTFSILHKLDHCFASLLSGEDYDTKEALPGFENGLRGGMSRTDMVRCKSLAQQTRILIVDVMSRGVEEIEDNGGDAANDSQFDTESGIDGPSRSNKGSGGVWNDDEEELYMDVARVYEKTLVKLGETLGQGGEVGDIQISAD
ncbi:hypothetical protein QBC38DRAFT_489394 [Podospora fimiseda]|uniref:Meiotic recombination protein DMC1 n=1 Tax=Podospora fimiseda TaxID=252190 RepID=A0AAN6YP05_9PEZI|nr:hypothetical protein QBC38DRAFT_489394 [Podospora fimiseda]